MPIVKIVILNWNGAEHLRRFLPSVVAAAPAGVGVVVADNGSTDGSLAVLAEEFPTVAVVRLDRNYGFAGGYNRALAQVEADYYLLLNSDVETPRGWLEPILGVLEREPDVAVVSPKLVSWLDRTRFEYAGALSTSWAILFAGGVSSSGSKPTRGSTTMPATYSGSAERLFAAVPTCSAY